MWEGRCHERGQGEKWSRGKGGSMREDRERDSNVGREVS